MKLQQLQALIALADGGGIRAAARMLGLSQAAVSKALRELEADQQLPLLQRHASGARLTEPGQALLTHARQISTQIERARDEMDALRGRHDARLCIGVTPWLARTLLPEVVLQFRQRLPSIRLELFEALQAVALPRLRDGQMDCAIGPLPGDLSNQEFHWQPLFSHACQVIARHGHPALRAQSLAELLEQDWVVNYSPASYRQVLNALFARHGLSIAPERLICAQSVALLAGLVQAGMLSYGPEPLLLCPDFAGKAQALPLRERLEDITIGVIGRQGRVHGYAASCFIACLQQTLRQRMRSARPEDRALARMLTLRF